MKLSALTCALSLGFSAPAFADGLSAKQTVAKQIELIDENGEHVTRQVEADSVSPGDMVVYSLNYVYAGNAPASDLVLTMPVPSELTLQADSTRQETADVFYSMDGARSFTALPGMLDSKANQDAFVSQITHLQWRLRGIVGPGETGSLGFAGLVR